MKNHRNSLEEIFFNLLLSRPLKKKTLNWIIGKGITYLPFSILIVASLSAVLIFMRKAENT